ncbi:MAG: carboxypeptidase-like regulatory domain-containing protein [Planctomycetes bacterium]|nr:carboxypeptidase-like regulatory domain-containing protein [Planctomycetota bacterium]
MHCWILTACVVLVASLLTGCDAERTERSSNVLSGHVAVGGRPAKDVTVIVRGPDDKESSSLTDTTGFYRIENVPTGKLTFLVSTFTPPPPPIVKGNAAVPPPGATIIPARFARPGNDLQFNHTGGNQTYDININ